IDDRKISIRRKSDIRHFLCLEIAFHAAESAFLVCADDQPDTSLELESCILDHFQRHPCSDRGAFIIDSAAPEQFSVNNLPAIRVFRPAISRRDDIDVTKNAEKFPPFACL